MQLYFAGYPSAGISEYLDMKPQTVNRILRKIRTSLVRQRRFHSLVLDEALKVGFYQIDLYVRINHAAYSASLDPDRNMMGNLRQCLSKCPRALGPTEFITKFVDIQYDNQTFPHPITPETKLDANIDEIFDEFGRRFSCGSCPIGKGREGLSEAFSKYENLYVDIMFYLYQNRIRTDDEFFYHISIATYIGVLRRIAAQRMATCRKRGIDDKTADRIITRKLVRMVNKVYDLLEYQPSDYIDMKGHYIYAEGSGMT